MPDRTPSVRPTGVTALVTAAVVGAGSAAIAGQALVLSGGSLPQPGPGGWMPVLLLAGVTVWLGWTTRRAIRTGRGGLDADVAVVRLRLAKAAALVAAGLGGAYAALAMLASGGWPAPLAQARVAHSVVAVVGCAVWLASALWLERCCRVPDDDPQD